MPDGARKPVVLSAWGKHKWLWGVVAGVIKPVVGNVGQISSSRNLCGSRLRERLRDRSAQQWLHLRYVRSFLAIGNSSIA